MWLAHGPSADFDSLPNPRHNHNHLLTTKRPPNAQRSINPPQGSTTSPLIPTFDNRHTSTNLDSFSSIILHSTVHIPIEDFQIPRMASATGATASTTEGTLDNPGPTSPARRNGRGRGRGRGAHSGSEGLDQSNPRGRGRGGHQAGRGRGRGNREGGSRSDRPSEKGKGPIASSGETQHAPVALTKPPAIQPAADAEEGEVCFICASPVQHTAVAPCNHRTCHICSLRLRALYKTKTCAHCRTESDHVVFTDDVSKNYEDFAAGDFFQSDDNLGIRFENAEILEDTRLLLQYNCPDSECDVACLGWPDLHRHVKTAHGKVMW